MRTRKMMMRAAHLSRGGAAVARRRGGLGTCVCAARRGGSRVEEHRSELSPCLLSRRTKLAQHLKHSKHTTRTQALADRQVVLRVRVRRLALCSRLGRLRLGHRRGVDLHLGRRGLWRRLRRCSGRFWGGRNRSSRRGMGGLGRRCWRRRGVAAARERERHVVVRVRHGGSAVCVCAHSTPLLC